MDEANILASPAGLMVATRLTNIVQRKQYWGNVETPTNNNPLITTQFTFLPSFPLQSKQ